MAYYVLNDNKCLYESLTKEQILAAITQAVSTHAISDVDTGFVTALKELNQSKALSFWVGTTAEYNAIVEKTDDCVYILTDDTELEDLEAEIAQINTSLQSLDPVFDFMDKKGEVLLDQSSNPIPLGTTDTFPLTGIHAITDYTYVDVYISAVEHVLCSVTPFQNPFTQQTDAYIKGMSNVPQGSDTIMLWSPTVVIETIDLYVANNVLTKNRSFTYVVNDPSGQLVNQGIFIYKIVGVM